MKTNAKTTHTALLRVAPIAIAMTASLSLLSAADYDREKSKSAASSAKEKSGKLTELRVMRATSYIGKEVRDSKGQKVGDIVDFAMDLRDPPRLHYVLASTGGILNLGGDVRAIPADALTVNDDHASIKLTKADYEKQTVLPDDRITYLTTAEHQKTINAHFNVSADAKMRTSAETARRADKNALGTLVLFSEIENESAETSDGTEIGRIADVWMNAKDNRVPYVEVRPAARMGPESPFSVGQGRNYAIPTAKVTNRQEDGGYTFNVTLDSLKQAERVSADSGVEMIEGGGAADTVLMVSVPKISETASRRQSADDANARTGSPSFDRDAARPDGPLGRSADKGVVRISDEIELAPDDVSESTVRHYAGKDVHSADGRKLGSVDDFIIDANSGNIVCAVVSTGIFGTGDKRAVPVSALNASKDGFSVNIQQAQWEQSPTLDKDAYDDGRPTMSENDRNRMNEIFGVRSGSPATTSNITPAYARASKLRGMQVLSAGGGGELGEIESVVVDPKSGKAAAVLDPDDDALDTEHKFLVPVAKLNVDRMNEDSDSIGADLSVEDLRKVAGKRVASAGNRE